MTDDVPDFTIRDDPTEADRAGILHARAAFNAESEYPGATRNPSRC